MNKALLKEVGKEVYEYISCFVDLSSKRTAVAATTTRFNIESLSDLYFSAIINIKRVNNIRYLNQFINSVNYKLPKEGIFIGCLENSAMRKLRIYKKYPLKIGKIYYLFDYIFKRVFPKLSLTKKLYFLITAGRNRVITRQEMLGRLYSCGFKVIDTKAINKNYYFVAVKTKEPSFDKSPTYGLFVKMNRIGKNNKRIAIYKIRTMYPYSEYLQEYIYEQNELAEGGKFKNDFRVTPLGRIFRKMWIDELPMIINLMKGDIKFVGVRPLSEHYFSLYDEEFQKRRIKYKPGLIPPFYADMPKTLEEIIESEKKYLDLYDKNHLRTDFIYFIKALKNIILKKARSK